MSRPPDEPPVIPAGLARHVFCSTVRAGRCALLWLGMLTLCDSCVLPDGLEVEKIPVEENQPPRILSQDPPFPNPNPAEPPLSLPANDSREGTKLRLSLDDPNFKDFLYLRMFVDYDTPGHLSIRRTDVSKPTTSSTVKRSSVEFTNLNCHDLGIDDPAAGAGGMAPTPIRHLLEVVVSDRAFDDASGATPIFRRTSGNGQSVTAYWVFTCEQ